MEIEIRALSPQEMRDWLATHEDPKQWLQERNDTAHTERSKEMISLSILTVIAVVLLSAVPFFVILIAAAVVALVNPFSMILAGYVWGGTQILNFVQSLFG